jgi:hypothetical protein
MNMNADTKYWFSTSSGLIEFELTWAQALQGSHQGQCDADIAELRKVPEIAEVLGKINKDTLRSELDEYGAWDEDELKDHEANLDRILWLACGDIREEHYKDHEND